VGVYREEGDEEEYDEDEDEDVDMDATHSSDYPTELTSEED
jgi:hypothetical protein